MARRYGRALRGERCRASVPHGHWKTTTFVGALRLEGMTAPMVLDGAGAELRFLPPCSPDFNPIEMAFSKFKASPKKTAARTLDDLWNAIAEAIDLFTPALLGLARSTVPATGPCSGRMVSCARTLKPRCRSTSGHRRFVGGKRCAVDQHAMQDHRELACERDLGLVLAGASSQAPLFGPWARLSRAPAFTGLVRMMCAASYRTARTPRSPILEIRPLIPFSL